MQQSQHTTTILVHYNSWSAWQSRADEDGVLLELKSGLTVASQSNFTINWPKRICKSQKNCYLNNVTGKQNYFHCD